MMTKYENMNLKELKNSILTSLQNHKKISYFVILLPNKYRKYYRFLIPLSQIIINYSVMVYLHNST